MALYELSAILWHERQLLGMMQRGASARFALHVAELDRAIVVEDLANRFELSEDVTLRELKESMPPPWPVVFDEHLDALSSAGEPLPRSLEEFLG